MERQRPLTSALDVSSDLACKIIEVYAGTIYGIGPYVFRCVTDNAFTAERVHDARIPPACTDREAR